MAKKDTYYNLVDKLVNQYEIGSQIFLLEHATEVVDSPDDRP